MKIEADTVDDYIAALPEERKDAFIKLRHVILENFPEGFEETIQYSMPAYVVPHSRYPAGYHVNPEDPLPFMSIASQKNFVALYHMGIYSDGELLNWFQARYPEHSKRKLNMGKSCIRFKKLDDIPFDLVGELAGKVSVDEWIAAYESSRQGR